MNNWRISWFFTHIFTGELIFKGLTARRLYKSFGVKGLKNTLSESKVTKYKKVNFGRTGYVVCTMRRSTQRGSRVFMCLYLMVADMR
jgi:hypothetical protein